jgi:hypothetical protein
LENTPGWGISFVIWGGKKYEKGEDKKEENVKEKRKETKDKQKFCFKG